MGKLPRIASVTIVIGIVLCASGCGNQSPPAKENVDADQLVAHDIEVRIEDDGAVKSVIARTLHARTLAARPASSTHSPEIPPASDALHKAGAGEIARMPMCCKGCTCNNNAECVCASCTNC